MAPRVRFRDGEKVLCFHGPLLYEAKCIKSAIREKNTLKYYIHYSGWNKNWDEWVPETRVLRYNDGNLQRQESLATLHRDKKKTGKSNKKETSDREATALPPQEKTTKPKSKEAPVASVSAETEMQRKKRTRAEQNVETEEEYTQKVEMKIKIPDELKHWLADDWNLINQQKKVLQLPARVSVETILSDYVKLKVAVKGMTVNKESAIIEVTNGIREYFNAMLLKKLLYNSERSRHIQLLSELPDMTPSQMYGAVHLLRLFTKIGGALAYTPLNEESINLLSQHIYDFLKYMSKSASSLFSLADYVTASPEVVIKKEG